ncbi:MAG: GntR family transcriptional regulator [bacterium]
MADNSGKIPLFVQVEAVLRDKIVKGQLGQGEQLPTLNELSAEFRVSQITIRTALANLKAERLISGKRGKGVFVAQQVPVRKHLVFTGDLQSFMEEWEKFKVKPLGVDEKKIRETRIPRHIGDFFGMDGQEPVCVIRRVRFIDGIPVSFFENFFRPEIGRQLTLRELSKLPVKRILETKLGLQVGDNETYLESVPAPPDVAGVLKAEVFAPLFLVQARLWDSSGEPLEIVNIFMRSDFFKYKIQVQRFARRVPADGSLQENF